MSRCSSASPGPSSCTPGSWSLWRDQKLQKDHLGVKDPRIVLVWVQPVLKLPWDQGQTGVAKDQKLKSVLHPSPSDPRPTLTRLGRPLSEGPVLPTSGRHSDVSTIADAPEVKCIVGHLWETRSSWGPV